MSRTLKLPVFCQNRQQREEAALRRHTLPQAELLSIKLYHTRGSDAIFGLPEVNVCCCCSQNSHSYTHRRRLAGPVLFGAWDGGVGFNTNEGDPGDPPGLTSLNLQPQTVKLSPHRNSTGGRSWFGWVCYAKTQLGETRQQEEQPGKVFLISCLDLNLNDGTL